MSGTRGLLAAVDSVYEVFGGVDLLVNNAGIGMATVIPHFFTEPLPFWQVPVTGFQNVLDTKVTGSFLAARAVVPRMLNTGAGRACWTQRSWGQRRSRG